MREETRSAAFRWFWFANFALGIGGRAWMVAIPILAIEYLSADSRQVGYLAAAATVGPLVFAVPFGVWIDRVSKRYAMIFSALIRAALTATIPVLWLCGWLGLPSLCCIALLVGVTNQVYAIAYQAYVPLLVGSSESYHANARLEVSSRAVNVGGPAAFGFALKFISAPVLIFIDALGYLMCAAILTRVPEREDRHRAPTERDLRRELVEGLRFVWFEPALRSIALAVVLSNFFASAIVTLTPVLVLETLHLGPADLGIAYTSAETGALVGALLLGQARRRFGIGSLLTGGLILAATFTALVVVAANLSGHVRLAQVVVMISLFGTAFGGVVFAVSQISLRQMLCPKDLLGRVNATMRFIVLGPMPIASVAAGVGAHAIGIASTLGIAALGTIVTVVPIVGISRRIPQAVADEALARRSSPAT